MPMYKFECPSCGHPFRRILTPKEAKEPVRCPTECGAQAVRTPDGPTTRVVETIDNGLQPRRTECLADVQRLLDERNLKHSQNMGEIPK